MYAFVELLQELYKLLLKYSPKNAKNDEKWLKMTKTWLEFSHMIKMRMPEDGCRWVLSENICICWVTVRNLEVMKEIIPKKREKWRKMT